MHKQVISEIVENNICVGCGICAGCCPSKNLNMGWLHNGDLAPSINSECPSKCNICLKVCPFSEDIPNETEIAEARFKKTDNSYDEVLGFYCSTYVGFSKDENQRSASASGGALTRILKDLLLNKEISSVFCVGQSNSKNTLFEFKEVTNINELDKCASSKYYPVDTSKIIKLLLDEKDSDRKIAITGLPCTLKGISLAMNQFPKLAQQIKFLFGLTCGSLPNKYYTEYLSAVSLGNRSAPITDVDFRSKAGTVKSSNYQFIARSNDRDGKPLPFNDVVSNIFVNGMFQFNSCNFCDDIFAEVADITIMDAWLPEYSSDPKGTSLIIIRSKILEEKILNSSSIGNLHIKGISPEKIIQSQNGVILKKRVNLPYRLSWNIKNGVHAPQKRVDPKKHLPWLMNLRISSRIKLQESSKQLWLSGSSPAEIMSNPSISKALTTLKILSLISRFKKLILNPNLMLTTMCRKLSTYPKQILREENES